MTKKLLRISKAVYWLMIATYQVKTKPFNEVVNRNGLAEIPVSQSEKELLDCVDEIDRDLFVTARYIDRLSRLILKNKPCMPAAVGSLLMLKNRNVCAYVYFGVNIESTSRAMSAHAWVYCQSKVLTGHLTAHQFKPVSCYKLTRSTRNQRLN